MLRTPGRSDLRHLIIYIILLGPDHNYCLVLWEHLLKCTLEILSNPLNVVSVLHLKPDLLNIKCEVFNWMISPSLYLIKNNLLDL